MKKVFAVRGIDPMIKMDSKNREDVIDMINARVAIGVEGVDTKDVVSTLKISGDEANEILQDLEEDGFIRVAKN